MLSRIYIKDFLSIKDLVLDIDSNFVVFSGPSGAGKSIFINAILSSFGFAKCDAVLVDIEVQYPLDMELFGIEQQDSYTFQRMKKKSAKHFINNQSVSKKVILDISSSFVNYLSINDNKEFENSSLLAMLDKMIIQKNKSFQKDKDKLSITYTKYIDSKLKLQTLIENEKNQTNLKDFLKFEIDNINKVSPKIGELEDLLITKRSISKKENILELIQKANPIFEYEDKVYDALSSLNISLTIFDEAMNDLRDTFETNTQILESLEDIDIENILDRIEKLSTLKTKYGSIEDAIKHKENKEKELEKLENITWEKDNIEKIHLSNINNLETICTKISKYRNQNIEILESKINFYLKKMFLNDISLLLNKSIFSITGQDTINVKLNNTDIKKISTGELNRVKLAFLATKNSIYLSQSNSILFLDEVDSNLSGKESMSVAKVLKELSQNYQVFAISHQPQLSSLATTHFLVDKKDNQTFIQELHNEQRINEVARMVSGDNITKEACEFAKTLIQS